jgi:hypothetical protein
MEKRVPPAEPDTFRRLIERQITTDEYVRTLDERVQKLRESDQPVEPLPRARDQS